MIRVIRIVLIVVIVLQTLGCSAWRPLTRSNEAPEEDRQASMRDRVQRNLKEGMRVRITIRAGTRVPITGRVIECVIEEIGHTSLTVVPFTSFARGNDRREFTLRYTDIVSIEYRGVARNSLVFFGCVAIGTILGFFGTAIIVF